MKRLEREALRLGLSIVSTKMAEAMGVPGLTAMAPMSQAVPQAMAPQMPNMPPRAFAQMPQQAPQQAPGQMSPLMGSIASTDAATETDAELPTTVEQTRDRSAKIAPGRVITTQ